MPKGREPYGDGAAIGAKCPGQYLGQDEGRQVDPTRGAKVCEMQKSQSTSKVGEAGEPCALKGASTVCAVRRVVVSLLEAGGMREDVPGLLAYLEVKTEGDQACQGSDAYSKAL